MGAAALTDGATPGSGSWEGTNKLPQFVSAGEPGLVKWHQIAQAKTMPLLELSLLCALSQQCLEVPPLLG